MLTLHSAWGGFLQAKRFASFPVNQPLFAKKSVQNPPSVKMVLAGGVALLSTAVCGSLLWPAVAFAIEIVPGFSLKAELVFESETQRNFDLDDTAADGFSFVEPSLSFELEAQPSDQVKAVVEVEASLREIIEDDADKRKSERKLELKQAYLQVEPDGSKTTFTAGRQDISDEMEWLIDEALDAARITYEADPIGFDLYVGRKSAVNLSTPAEEEELVTNYAGFLRYQFNKESYVDSFVFYRDGESTLDDGAVKEEDLLFLGVQSIGQLGENLNYWLNAAYLTGSSREGNERQNILAFGGDIGATYAFDVELEPSITLAFAYGSGDSNLDDDNDHTFRQTGLHDNSYKFNGVTSFSYLGMLLDPEIGNLMIFTAGAGIKPTEKSSIDLVYHYYSQVEAADELVDTNLDMDPDGVSADIGHGLDLVLGYREIPNLDVDVSVGAFVPGKAFPNASGNAYFGKIELTFSF